MLLFLVAAGLTLTLGVMRLINLTHGAFYLIGVYVAYAVIESTGNVPLAWVAGGLGGAVLGIATYYLLKRAVGNHLREALLTFGLVFIIGDQVLARWGGTPFRLQVPDLLAFPADLAVVRYPAYRLLIIGCGVFAAIAMWLVAHRTTVGAQLRAVIDDAQMGESVGIHSSRVMAITFVIGAALAGLAGVLGGPILGGFPGIDMDILLLALVVVIVGGAGSVSGAFIGALVVGLVDTFAVVWIPQFSIFAVFATMLLVLAVRPAGLAGGGHI